MFIEREIVNRAKLNVKTILLPEAMLDERVVQAGILAAKRKIAKIVFIGDDSLKQYENKFLKVINQKTYENKQILANRLFKRREHKGMSLEQATKLIEENLMFFAAALVENDYVDGVVAGCITKTEDVFRAALQVVGAREGIKTVSSAFILSGKSLNNEKRCVVLSDCGLIIEPDANALADIAIATAGTVRGICGMEPKMAFLSFTTGGEAKTQDLKNIFDAMQILKDKKVNFEFDGPLQVDAAMRKSVAKIKAPQSKVAGVANCFIFPNLMAGNIGYKLMQYGSDGALRAIGPFTQGLNKRINDLSRGATVEEIVLSIAVTSIQI